jgi:hypothetical protein
MTSRVRGGGKEGGLALILCLLCLTILIIVITQFAYSVKVEEKVSRNSKDDVKALFAARGALAYVRAFLRDDRRKQAAADSLREDWAGEALQAVRVGDSDVRMTVEDADRCLNVNLFADDSTKEFAKGVLERLCTKLEIENGAEVASRIADWIDPDTEGEYEVAGAKNGPLTHVDELFEIRDIPVEALLGPPAEDGATTASNPLLSAGRRTAGATSSGAQEGQRAGLLAPTALLTTWGSGKININTAPEDILWAMFPDKVNGKPAFSAEERDEAVRKIIEYRTGGEQAQSGAGTGAGARSTGSTGAAAKEKPGKDFEKVEDLGQVVPEAQPLLERQQGPQGGGATDGATGGGAAGGADAKKQPKPFREMIGVAALDYRITMDITRGLIDTRYEAILRRGNEEFHTLLWREVPR